MWLFTLLLFKLTSSRQARQNSFPRDAISCSPGNRLMRCTGLMLLGSELEELHLTLRRPPRTRFVATFRFRVNFDAMGARSLSSTNGRLKDSLPLSLSLPEHSSPSSEVRSSNSWLSAPDPSTPLPLGPAISATIEWGIAITATASTATWQHAHVYYSSIIPA